MHEKKCLQDIGLKSSMRSMFFPIMEIYMNFEWLNKSHMKTNLNKVLKGWKVLDKTYQMITPKGYKKNMFKNPIQILNALLCQLYGEKDSTIF